MQQSDIQFASSTMGKVYAVDTAQIKAWNEAALANDYNRAFNEFGIASLDEKGVHFIQCTMALHVNYAGKVTMRAFVLLQLNNQTKRQPTFLDISHTMWREFCEVNEPMKK